MVHDYLVVGSGCSGALAAQTLVEQGLNVLMVDVGVEKPIGTDVPDSGFLDLRRTDPEQYRYLIGEQASHVLWGKVGKGEQVTPPRGNLFAQTDKYIPVESKTFSPLESLAYGGLGIAWGLQAWQYSKADLEATGMDIQQMHRAYQYVANHIGVTAAHDDGSSFTLGKLKGTLTPTRLDRNHHRLYQNYQQQRQWFMDHGFAMGRTPLAIVTEKKADRKAYAYRDLDYYSDNDESAWRPWVTINRLKKSSHFSYRGGLLVSSFRERANAVEITCIDTSTNKHHVLRCRHLILAASVFGTARIVLRSLGQPSTQLPFLCNPYSYLPTIQPRFVGQAAEPKKFGYAQLSLFLDPDGSRHNFSAAALYGYQSLMLFRLLRHAPIDFADARLFLQYISSGFVIMGVHHPDSASPHKFIRLQRGAATPTGDILHMSYALSDSERAEYTRREKQFMRGMRKLGAFCVKRIDPGFGASIHYAGTLPFADEDRPFTLNPNGRLHGTRHVYVADGSGFRYLPAPGLTFSIMANAHLVAQAAARHD